jgi:hypothetical protein
MSSELLKKNGAATLADGLVFMPDCEPKHVYWILRNGVWERVEALPPPRNHTVNDLKSLVALCREFADKDDPASVWVNRDGIVAVLNDEGSRRDVIRFPLTRSEQMDLVFSLEEEESWWDRSVLARELKSYFPCLGQELIDSIRDGEERPGHINVFAKVFVQVVRVGSLVASKSAVKLNFEGRVDDKVCIWVDPGSYEEAMWQAEEDLESLVRAAFGDDLEYIHVYRGSP